MGWEWGIDEAADNDIDLLLAPNFLLSESRREDILVVSSGGGGGGVGVRALLSQSSSWASSLSSPSAIINSSVRNSRLGTSL